MERLDINPLEKRHIKEPQNGLLHFSNSILSSEFVLHISICEPGYFHDYPKYCSKLILHLTANARFHKGSERDFAFDKTMIILKVIQKHLS